MVTPRMKEREKKWMITRARDSATLANQPAITAREKKREREKKLVSHYEMENKIGVDILIEENERERENTVIHRMTT